MKILLKIHADRFLPLEKGGQEGFENARYQDSCTMKTNLPYPLFTKEGDLNHHDFSQVSSMDNSGCTFMCGLVMTSCSAWWTLLLMVGGNQQ
jgi:hypothetical protein